MLRSALAPIERTAPETAEPRPEAEAA